MSSGATRAAVLALLLAVHAGCAAGPATEPAGSAASPAGGVPTPTTAMSGAGTPGVGASPAGSATASPSRPATLGDVAAFLRSPPPPGVTRLDGVAADLDGDGGDEVLLGGLRDGRGWVATAVWDGTAFVVAAQGTGGPGDRVADLRLADINLDGTDEVVLEVAGAGVGSLALWSVPAPDQLRPLRARGGCHAGSHVYGAMGAELVRGRAPGLLDVVASCDDAPLPVADWSSHRYVWSGSSWVRQPPGAPPLPVPTPPGATASDPPGVQRDEPVATGEEVGTGVDGGTGGEPTEQDP